MKLLYISLILALLVNNPICAMNNETDRFEIRKGVTLFTAPHRNNRMFTLPVSALAKDAQGIELKTAREIPRSTLAPAQGLLKLVPGMAQFSNDVWRIISSYTLSFSAQSILFDLSKFQSAHNEKWKSVCIDGYANHTRTKYIRHMLDPENSREITAIYDAQSHKRLCEVPDICLSMADWAPDDQLIAISALSNDDHTLIIDASSGRTVASIPNGIRTKVSWNNEMTQIATLYSNGLSHSMGIWDISKPKAPRFKLEHEDRSYNKVSWIPTKELIVAQADKSLDVFNSFTGEFVRSLELSETCGGIRESAISPFGKYLAGVGNDNNELNIWDIKTGELNHRFNSILKRAPTMFSWTPDENRLVVQQDNQCVHIIDLRTGNRRTISQNRNACDAKVYQETPASWSVDGKQLTVYSLEGKTTYNFQELHTFDDCMLTPEQTILLKVLDKYKFKENRANERIKLESIAHHYRTEQITKHDLFHALVSFPPKIRLAIIKHYQITDAFCPTLPIALKIAKTCTKKDSDAKRGNEQITREKS